MWSLGCIIAELYTSKVLFPGENEKEQIAAIMEVQSESSSSVWIELDAIDASLVNECSSCMS